MRQITPEHVRQLLREYRSTMVRYRSLKETYDELFPSAVSRMGESGHVQTDTQRNTLLAMDNIAQRRMEVSDQMTAMLGELAKSARLACDLVALADRGDQQAVLQMRYLEGRTCEDVAEAMDVDPRTIYNISNRAINQIVRRINASQK